MEYSYLKVVSEESHALPGVESICNESLNSRIRDLGEGVGKGGGSIQRIEISWFGCGIAIRNVSNGRRCVGVLINRSFVSKPFGPEAAFGIRKRVPL